ncbi:unnamed protein product, partial [Phaeothamnion confervicola]
GEHVPYETVLGTMLHELAHNEFGPHDTKFYKLLGELTMECDKLTEKGIDGRDEPFSGTGRRLASGHKTGPRDPKAAAANAAEARQRRQAVLGGGGGRLGGAPSGRPSSPPPLLLRIRAVAAAERRLTD